jgi:hypothetical protein
VRGGNNPILCDETAKDGLPGFVSGLRFSVVMSLFTAAAMTALSLICRLLEEVVAFEVGHLEVEDVRDGGGYVD